MNHKEIRKIISIADKSDEIVNFLLIIQCISKYRTFCKKETCGLNKHYFTSLHLHNIHSFSKPRKRQSIIN